jgi:Uncharacterized membrane-anchored protein conserved in bacteria
MKKTVGISLAIFFFVMAPTGGMSLAQDSQGPIIQIPMSSPSEIASRAPRSGETLPNYINRVSVKGPAKIVMKNQASFYLPKDYLFVPDKSAYVLLNEIDGAKPSSEIMGLIFPGKEELGYILFDYYPLGYIRDDNFKNVNAAQLLTQMKNRTESQNSERRANSNPAIKVIDWLEKPNYAPTTNRLTWSVLTEEQQSNVSGQGVNYDTVLLGRKGYFHVLLVTNAESFKMRRPEIATLLSTFEFNQGSRYTDFNSTTDSVANCSLDALLSA